MIFSTTDRTVTFNPSSFQDTVIFERLSKSEKNLYLDATTKDLIEFANKGYRTLCLAKADISEDRYAEWRRGFYEASIAMERREQRLAEEADKIERDLTLIGATAIEDKLQDVRFPSFLSLSQVFSRHSCCPLSRVIVALILTQGARL